MFIYGYIWKKEKQIQNIKKKKKNPIKNIRNWTCIDAEQKS